MIDTAEFIARHWYKDDTIENVKRVRELLAYPGIYTEGTPDAGLILVYLTLSDEGLRMLKSAKTPEDFKNGFSETILQHPGEHIYVFRMVSEGHPSLRTLRILRTRIMTKHHATSFSWHDNEHVMLHTYGVQNV